MGDSTTTMANGMNWAIGGFGIALLGCVIGLVVMSTHEVNNTNYVDATHGPEVAKPFEGVLTFDVHSFPGVTVTTKGANAYQNLVKMDATITFKKDNSEARLFTRCQNALCMKMVDAGVIGMTINQGSAAEKSGPVVLSFCGQKATGFNGQLPSGQEKPCFTAGPL